MFCDSHEFLNSLFNNFIGSSFIMSKKLSEQLQYLVNSVDGIKSAAMKQKGILVVPKKSIIQKAVDIVIKFIKRKNLVVYGGVAINAAILKKDPTMAIYTDTELPDLDFYTPNPIKDGIELCNELQKMGIKYADMREALHQCTFKIKVEMYEVAIADISWVHKDVYKYIYECQSFVGYQGLRYVSPSFQVIDLYGATTNALDGGFYKLEKVIKRESILNKLYFNNKADTNSRKLIKDTWAPMAYHSMLQTIVKWVEDEIKNFDKTIILGRIAYNTFIKKSGIKNSDNRLIHSLPVEVLSEDVLDIVEYILKKIGSKIQEKHYPFKLEIREYYHYFRFLGRRIIIIASFTGATKEYNPILVTYDVKEVITLKNHELNITDTAYIYSESCAPYKIVNGQRIGSYHLTLKYLCGVYHWLLQNRKKGKTFMDMAYMYQYMIKQIRFAMISWRSTHGLKTLTNDKSLFQLAQVKNLMVVDNLESSFRRSALWKKFDQLQTNTYGRFIYQPDVKKLKVQDVVMKKNKFNQRLMFAGKKLIPHFPNNSGNRIVNQADPRLRFA